jgi:hypothetical protein
MNPSYCVLYETVHNELYDISQVMYSTYEAC